MSNLSKGSQLKGPSPRFSYKLQPPSQRENKGKKKENKAKAVVMSQEEVVKRERRFLTNFQIFKDMKEMGFFILTKKGQKIMIEKDKQILIQYPFLSLILCFIYYMG